MKVIHNRYCFAYSLLLAAQCWQSCCKGDLISPVKWSIISVLEIPDATVKVGDDERKTNKNGEFQIWVQRAERYVLNVSEKNSGFVSKIALKLQ